VNERFSSAAAFGDALRRARMKFAPQIGDKDLGALLSASFAKEKEGEDAVIHEAVYGKTATYVAPERTKQVQIVPANALAFEHTAAEQPLELSDRDDNTDPDKREPVENLPTGPISAKALNARSSFGMRFQDAAEPLIERSIIQEIEAEDFDDSLEIEVYESRVHQEKHSLALRVFAFTGIFLLATVIGFGLMWSFLK
jgi:hypothetical protein